MPTDSFTYAPLSIEVFFGNGRFGEVAEITSRFGLNRVLALSTKSDRAQALAQHAGAQLGARLAGYFSDCVEQVPVESAAKAQTLAKSLNIDGVVCVGGGSTIGHGKAIAIEHPVKLLHVVTTYSGSEMSAAQGFVENGVKRLVMDPRMEAKGVIYDPELTVSLPPGVSGPSGMNAMAHCVEGLYGAQANPVSNLMAGAGIKALGGALQRVVEQPSDLDARADVLFGAYMSGICISAGVALHHHVAHVLGGSFGVPHALAHTLALPHTIAYNRAAVPVAMQTVADALDCTDGPQGIFDLSARLGIDMSLSAHGFDHSQIDAAVALLLAHARPNPRRLEREALVQMFHAMVDGRRPELPANG